MKISTLAWRNVITNPLNLILNIILFGLGVGLISFLLMFNQQLKDKFDNNLAGIDLVVGAKGSPLQLILCSMYHIDNPTGNIPIKTAAPVLRPNHPLIKKAIPLSLGDNYKGYRIVGTNHGIIELYNGRLESGELYKNNLEVVIGKAVANETNLKIGDEFSSAHGFEDDQDLTHDHTAFKVTGILAGTASVLDQLILTNTASIWAVHDHHEDENTGENHDHTEHGEIADHTDHLHNNSNSDLLQHQDKDITSVLIQYKNRTNFQALNFGRNINENTEMQAASPAIEINRLYSMIGVGTDTLRSLAIIIAIVSALSIFISLYRSMKERKYELALLRVMGASRIKIFMLIILEGLILAAIGYFFGALISHLSMEWMASYLKSDFRYNFTGWLILKEEWILFGVSLVIGFIASIIPAIQSARSDIHKILSEK